MPWAPKQHRPYPARPRDERLWASRRAEYRKWYQCARWRRLRQLVLNEQPLCAECQKQGRLTPATAVDHIEPHLGDIEKFYSRENLRALCGPCHSRKTATSDGGFGNRKAKR